MKIQINRIPSYSADHERCYVHARGLLTPDGFSIITMQKLDLAGSDVFYGIECVKSLDGGEKFSKPEPCRNLVGKSFADGTRFVMCDATPYYHSASKKVILTGHMAWYGTDNRLLREPRQRSPVYAVYDEVSGDFGELKMLEMPEDEPGTFFSSGAGCSQILELENGDILIPIYFKSRESIDKGIGRSSIAVLRCSFDGETMKVLEIGNKMTIDRSRGLGEPSVAYYNGKYFLTIRSDETGYATKSKDGLHYEPIAPLCFDNGENLGSYNTQQHWIVGGGKIWLVYTRRAENNGHVFRHRAPLFMGEFDPVNMCVIRDTECIVVPERGARLGNFGCQSCSEDMAVVFAAEWMQNDPLGWDACSIYGSDNSIYVTKLYF